MYKAKSKDWMKWHGTWEADYLVGDGSALTGTGGVTVVTSDPASSTDGTMILNTTDNKVKMWYSSAWQTLHTFPVDVLLLKEDGDNLLLEDGFNIIIAV